MTTTPRTDVEALAEALQAIGYGDTSEDYIPAEWLLSYLPDGWHLTRDTADADLREPQTDAVAALDRALAAAERMVSNAGHHPRVMVEVTREMFIDILVRPLIEARARDTADADNPAYDGTDAAHPAWWRGSDHATAILTADAEGLLAAVEAWKNWRWNESPDVLRVADYELADQLDKAKRRLATPAQPEAQEPSHVITTARDTYPSAFGPGNDVTLATPSQPEGGDDSTPLKGGKE